MRPKFKILEEDLIIKIIEEAKNILCKIGIEIHNQLAVSLLLDNGAKFNEENKRILFTEDLIEKSLKTVKNSFKLYDVKGNETHNFINDNVYFTPGSAAINILDYRSKSLREPTTEDYIKYAKIISQLNNIASQSTAFIPSDVPEKVSDSYRLYLSLIYCEKPVITGAFTIEGFNVMKELLLAVRGTEKELKEKPLAIFSCCPTSPLKWSEAPLQNLIDCADNSIPIELISMPLSGFLAPVSLVGTLIQHTAETLSGVVIAELVKPGSPILYGGSPAIFDIRNETTPMGAIETMMIDCAYCQIGKYLGLPTQAYISLSDAKQFDAQMGLESGIGAILAALSGINNIAGPGMLDFESGFSLEKLILDNEICGMAFRLIKGIEPKEDFPAFPIFEELIKEGHLLISKHTRKYLKEEHIFPSNIIDRLNRNRWEEESCKDIYERAHRECNKLIENYAPSIISDETKKDLTEIMMKWAHLAGMDNLPIFNYERNYFFK